MEAGQGLMPVQRAMQRLMRAGTTHLQVLGDASVDMVDIVFDCAASPGQTAFNISSFDTPGRVNRTHMRHRNCSGGGLPESEQFVERTAGGVEELAAVIKEFSLAAPPGGTWRVKLTTRTFDLGGFPIPNGVACGWCG